MVFKVLMSREWSTVKNLQLIAKKINMLNAGNDMLRALSNLQDLNLAANEIAVIQNLECLKNLKSLNLSSNRIKEIPDNFNLPLLNYLNLDYNQIDKIQNLKGVKKLE